MSQKHKHLPPPEDPEQKILQTTEEHTEIHRTLVEAPASEHFQSAVSRLPGAGDILEPAVRLGIGPTGEATKQRIKDDPFSGGVPVRPTMGRTGTPSSSFPLGKRHPIKQSPAVPGCTDQETPYSGPRAQPFSDSAHAPEAKPEPPLPVRSRSQGRKGTPMKRSKGGPAAPRYGTLEETATSDPSPGEPDAPSGSFKTSWEIEPSAADEPFGPLKPPLSVNHVPQLQDGSLPRTDQVSRESSAEQVLPQFIHTGGDSSETVLPRTVPNVSAHQKDHADKSLEPPEDAPATPHYGTLEEVSHTPVRLGEAGGDAIAIATAPVFWVDNPETARDDHRDMILTSPENSAREWVSDPDSGVEFSPSPGADHCEDWRDTSPPTSRAVEYEKRTWGRVGRKKPLRSVLRSAAREVDVELVRHIDADDITSREALTTTRYGIRGATAGVEVGKKGVQGSVRLTRYGFALRKDVANGTLTSKQALAALGARSAKNAASAISIVGGAAKGVLDPALMDFGGGDDLGAQTFTAARNAVVDTQRAYRLGKTTYKAVSSGAKKAAKGFRAAKRTGHAAAQAVSATAKKVLANPIVLKGILAAGVVVFLLVLVVGVVSAIISAFTSSLSGKSDDWNLTQAYLYVTQLDADLQYSLTCVNGVDQYRYTINGGPETNSIQIRTNADLVLMYLDSKYEEWNFSKVKAEIEAIHAALYQVVGTRHQIVGGETWRYTTLTTTSLQSYIDANAADEAKDLLTAHQEVGAYSSYAELYSPFPDIDWTSHISSRFGWRVRSKTDPTTGKVTLSKENHNALDIALPSGTEIHACMAGTVEISGYHDSYGIYAKVKDEKGNYNLYAHMSGIAVSNGQSVAAGDLIGYVGSTGNSTGPHLHLEYFKDGHMLNPLFFIQLK